MTTLINDRDSALVADNIAIKFARDAAGRVHFRSASQTSHAASRFTRVQQAFLEGKLKLPTPTTQIALSLILFDGIATQIDLVRALENLNQLYGWDGHVCLDWNDPIGRQNRRHLSLITQAILAQPLISFSTVTATLETLDLSLREVVRSPNHSYSLNFLLLDAQAWLREMIPDPLFAHCVGAASISGLRRSTLARQESGLALSPKLDEESIEQNNEGFARAMGIYFNTLVADQGRWAIDELVTICRRDKTVSNTKDRQRMLDDCEGLACRDVEISAAGGLIMAWAIDLLQSGTRTKPILMAVTPAKYVSIAAIRLWNAFCGKDVESISTSGYLTIYKDLMDGLSLSRKRTMASALNSWHYFLTCWFDVPPLYQSLHKGVPASPPKANVIWDHELTTIRAWLATPMPDARHQSQLQIAIEIASQVRIRAGELLGLRLQNLHFEQESLTIEIATKPADGGVKTPSAIRRVVIKNADRIRQIRAWHDHRNRDGGLPSDYLFGDPYRPAVRYKAGLLYSDLNRLLKAVTGDPAVALHTLSHTLISNAWLRAAYEERSTDINPFERESIEAAHASSATGFVTYFHFFEGWLRDALDKRIKEQFFGKWRCIKDRVAKKPDAFRQARSRARRDGRVVSAENFASEMIEQASRPLAIPPAATGIALSAAKNPIIAAQGKPLTLGATLDILHDIRHGHSIEAIAVRSTQPPEQINALAKIAIEVLQDIGEADRRTPMPVGDSTIPALATLLQSSLRQRVQFERAGQAKVAFVFDAITSGRHPEITARGIAAWANCYRHGYLSFTPAPAALPIIKLLDATGFPRYLVVVKGIPEMKHQTLAAFRATKPELPTWEATQPRHGRPRAYLTLASGLPDPNKNSGNAALGMGGFHAVLFAASIRTRLLEQQS